MKNNTHWLVSILLTLLVGIVMTNLSLYLIRPKSVISNTPAPTVEYGRHLLRETASILGPKQADPLMRYSGTNMACASCHLDTGQMPGTLSLYRAATRYPKFSRRDGGIKDLKDRINGCMQRSMNGQPLPRDSVEMIAMEAYILHLGEQFAAMGESQRISSEPPAFNEPKRMANIKNGSVVYQKHCKICHGESGEGLQSTTDLIDGYLFPPLWGHDSYNNGAGMARTLTAARFIKARMPLGKPSLSDDQAYDVAAYINSNQRPIKSNLEVDFPDLTHKPVDSPYLPYADSFSQEQHRLGPFAPIREYYKSLDEN